MVDAGLTRHGGLSYLEIPAADAGRSAAFYEHVLGWTLQRRDANDIRFADATGHLIGRWVLGRASAAEPGLVPYFYVDQIHSAVERATVHNGEVVKAPYREGDLWVATLRDPAGNTIGLWQAFR
ncbi:MAG TPA: VOC family protein [Polyangia bacterium]|nr:VOC family protein [Polyangia bacterium]